MNNHEFEFLTIRISSAQLNRSSTSNNTHGTSYSVCDGEYMPSTYACHHYIPDSAILLTYILILFFNFVGNGIILSIILLKRKMRTFTNYMLLNLCVADLAIGVFCMIMEIPMEVHPHEWVYGRGFCHLLYPIQSSTVYSSVFTLVGLSCSRYHAIDRCLHLAVEYCFCHPIYGIAEV